MKFSIKKHLLLFILFLSINLKGQNLVPNGDFENFPACNNLFGSLPSWINLADNTGIPPPWSTPDIFNSCNSNSIFQVPGNFAGFQPAYNGQSYAGIALWNSAYNNFREYIEAPLSSTLQAGVSYSFSMRVNLSNISKYTTDAIGVYFSDVLISGVQNPCPLNFNPQIVNSSQNFFDTISWKKVSAEYIAQGGEKYIIIGNFKDSSLTTLSLINNASTNQNVYVYIDAVSLVTSNVLPIELLSFTAALNNRSTVDLHWQTASETNNDFFTVEKSVDGKVFEKLGEVRGQGNSSTLSDYYLEDANPFSRITYYRLKQTDYDGKFTYSDVVAVKKHSTTGIAIFPNPAQEFIFVKIDGEFSGDIEITLFDALAKICYQQSFVAKDDFVSKIDLGKLRNGIYSIRVNTSTESFFETIILTGLQ